jgi:hypothetical protein
LAKGNANMKKNQNPNIIGALRCLSKTKIPHEKNVVVYEAENQDLRTTQL